MKKKIFSLVAIAAISLGVWNYSENQTNVELSDLALANVEALASGEYHPGTCGWSPNGVIAICNIREDHVYELFHSFGGWWCCDSCSSTSYCG
jgi:hypothetical protein